MITRLPVIHGNAIAGQHTPCGMVAQAQQFAAAWMALLGDKAQSLTCHPIATAAAQQQADWLAVHDFDKDDPHLGEGGSYANERLARLGYPLPFKDMQANYVESAQHITQREGESDDELATRGAHSLANHDERGKSHKEHMQFLGDFWGRFRHYGVGAAQAQFGERPSWFFVCVTLPPVDAL